MTLLELFSLLRTWCIADRSDRTLEIVVNERIACTRPELSSPKVEFKNRSRPSVGIVNYRSNMIKQLPRLHLLFWQMKRFVIAHSWKC